MRNRRDYNQPYPLITAVEAGVILFFIVVIVWGLYGAPGIV